MYLKIKGSLVILIFLLVFSNCKEKSAIVEENTNYSILIPKINNQELYEGTSMKVHFAAIDDHLQTLQFNTENLPDFVKMITHKNGSGYFAINAKKGTKGKYKITLFADNNREKGKQSFQLEVLPIPPKVLYLSPESDDFNAVGTIESPLPSLEKITKSNRVFEPNTHLILMDGYHGRPNYSLSRSHIYAAVNAEPVLSGITFTQVSYASMTGIEISPEGNAPFEKKFLITIDSLSSGVKISNCQIRTVKNTADWTQDQWDEKSKSGLMVYGKECTISNNLFKNVFHALQTDANNAMIDYNIIDRFAGDAIRNTGDYNSYTYNLIKNAVVDDYSDPDGNHDDCFQSWTFDNPIRNIKLKNNIAISCLEPDLPLKSRVVQGIACFDGFEEGWIVDGNLVILDHPHGIALFGARNCKVINNLVLRNPYRLFSFESDPWVMINNHKDGRPSMNNTIINNLCGALQIKDSLGINQENIVIDGQYQKYLKDYNGWDFRRK